MSTARTVTTGRGYRARVSVEPGRVVVCHESQHPWFPSIWLARGAPDVLRSRDAVQAHTRHRGLRLVLLAAWVDAVSMPVQRAEAVRA